MLLSSTLLSQGPICNQNWQPYTMLPSFLKAPSATRIGSPILCFPHQLSSLKASPATRIKAHWQPYTILPSSTFLKAPPGTRIKAHWNLTALYYASLINSPCSGPLLEPELAALYYAFLINSSLLISISKYPHSICNITSTYYYLIL